MGVDGISGGGPPRIPDAPSADGASSKEHTFKVGEADATETVSADLSRVESGEMSIEEYLDARVEQATAHLQAALPPEQLQLLQETLREQLSTDPVVASLVQRATGKKPA